VGRESNNEQRTTNNEQRDLRPGTLPPCKTLRVSHNVLINSNHYLRGSGDPVADYSYFVGLTQQFQQHDHALFTVLLGENGFHAGKGPVRQFDPDAACSKRHTSSPSPRVPTDVAERRKGSAH
jgi:hypothetical protein